MITAVNRIGDKLWPGKGIGLHHLEPDAQAGGHLLHVPPFLFGVERRMNVQSQQLVAEFLAANSGEQGAVRPS